MENIESIKSTFLLNEQFGEFDFSKLYITEKEKEILNLILAGFENKAISKKLFISIKTVEVHKQNIKDKLNIRSIKELYE